MSPRRLSELEPALPEELAQHGDVCAICYQEMILGAVITECKHYFHTHCLRKWLVQQDNCPMCTRSIVSRPEEKVQEENAIEVEEELLEEEQVVEELPEDNNDASNGVKEDEPGPAAVDGVRRRCVVVEGMSNLFDGD